MKKLVFCGAPSRIPDLGSKTTEELHAISGRNSGNLVIGYSVKRQLVHDEAHSRSLYMAQMPAEEVNERYDAVVIACSNFVNPYEDFGTYADYFSRLTIPIVAIGLGSQARLGSAPVIALKEGTRRFLQEISAHSHSIGVRGEFTAACLRQIGILNVEVIGCPSYFMKCQPFLDIHKKSSLPVKIACNNEQTLRQDPAQRPLFETLFAAGLKYRATYFAQNEHPLLFLARGIAGEITPAVQQQALRLFFRKDDDMEALEYLMHHVQVHYDVERWSEVIREFDFSFGPRFHGNLLAVINGVPALFIAHDVRTRELCDSLSLPCLEASAVSDFPILKHYEDLEFSETNRKYPELYRRYMDFLERNNLDHRMGQPADRKNIESC